MQRIPNVTAGAVISSIGTTAWVVADSTDFNLWPGGSPTLPTDAILVSLVASNEGEIPVYMAFAKSGAVAGDYGDPDTEGTIVISPGESVSWPVTPIGGTSPSAQTIGLRLQDILTSATTTLFGSVRIQAKWWVRHVVS